MRPRYVALVAISLTLLMPTASRAQTPKAIRTVCDPEEQPLFICETNRKDKYVAICATEAEVGKQDAVWLGCIYDAQPKPVASAR